MSLLVNTISTEMHPIFTINVMWNIATENSPSGEFFNYFFIYYVCMLLERYLFSLTVVVKIFDIIKKSFLSFTYGN